MSASSFPTKQKKFGLILNKKKTNATRKPTRSLTHSLDLFTPEEDDDEDEASAIARANKQLAHRTVTNSMSESVSECVSEGVSSVYDYDGCYDEFKSEALSEKKKSLLRGDTAAPKSKYVQQLQSVAKVREIESDRRYERKLLKERAEEDEQFGHKQKFVTSAYRKKLEEEKQWEYEDRLADKIEERTGATRQGMQGFYSNLFTKNIAYGGDVSAATSAYTAGSERQRMRISEQVQEQVQEQEEGVHSPHEAHSSDDSVQQKDASGTPHTHSPTPSVKRVREDTSSEKQSEQTHDVTHSNTHEEEARSEKKQKVEGVSEGVSEGVAVVVSREAVIMSAKERYLARKNSKK